MSVGKENMSLQHNMAGLPEELFPALQELPNNNNNNKDHSTRGSVADAERGGPHCFQGFFLPQSTMRPWPRRRPPYACVRAHESDAVATVPPFLFTLGCRGCLLESVNGFCLDGSIYYLLRRTAKACGQSSSLQDPAAVVAEKPKLGATAKLGDR